MRLYADDREDRGFWSVIHVPSASKLTHVVWVDDEAHQYCVDVIPLKIDPVTGETAKRVHQAKLVKIFMARRLVLIDPVDDAENKCEEVENRCLQDLPAGCII